jgi:hypothetical protein
MGAVWVFSFVGRAQMSYNVYFYNMTNQPLTLTVNQFAYGANPLASLPASAPYTPNASTAYTRVVAQPQINQIGPTNTISYMLSSQPTPVSVTLQIGAAYPVVWDILVYLFYNSIVAACVMDGTAYLGVNGGKAYMGPSTDEEARQTKQL